MKTKFIVLCFFMLLPLCIMGKKIPFGNGLFWEMKKDTLIISGIGYMPFNDHPWKKKLQKIKIVKIEEGVSSVSDNAFSNYFFSTERKIANIYKIYLPNSVKSIGEGAFACHSKLSHVVFPKGLERIGDYAFCMTNISNVFLPEGVKEIGNRAFTGVVYRDNDQYGRFSKNITIYVCLPNSIKKEYFNSNDKYPFYGDIRYLYLPSYITRNNCTEWGIAREKFDRYFKCVDGVYDSTYRQIVAPKAGRIIKREIDDITGEHYYWIRENGLFGAVDQKGKWIAELSDLKSVENATEKAISAYSRNLLNVDARDIALENLQKLRYIEGPNSLDIDPTYQLGHYYCFGRFDVGKPFSKKGIQPVDARMGLQYLKNVTSLDLYKLFSDKESWLYDPQLAIEAYTLSEGYIGGTIDNSDFVNKILHTDTCSFVDVEALYLRRYANFVERENENDVTTVLAFLPSQINAIVGVANKMPKDHSSAAMNLTGWSGDSLFLLGLGYHKTKRFNKALYYFRRAAAKGNANAYTMSVIALDSIIRNTCYDGKGTDLQTNYRVAYAFTQFFPWEKEGKEKFHKEYKNLKDFYENSCELFKAEVRRQEWEKMLAQQKQERLEKERQQAEEAKAEARRARRMAFFGGLLQGMTQMANSYFNPGMASYSGSINQLLNPNMAIMQTMQQNAQFQHSLNASLQSSMNGLNSLMEQSQQLFQQKLSTWSMDALRWENEHPMGYTPVENNISGSISSDSGNSHVVGNNDSHTTLQGRFCDSCRGRGICGKCEGNPKGLWSEYAGHSGWIKCPACTNGKCNSCGGIGRRL